MTEGEGLPLGLDLNHRNGLRNAAPVAQRALACARTHARETVDGASRDPDGADLNRTGRLGAVRAYQGAAHALRNRVTSFFALV
jgi:hypothetical protein